MLLPYPISTNRYWRTFRGRTVRSAEAVAYKDHVISLASESQSKVYTCPVEVRMMLHPERPLDWAKRAKRDPDWALSVRRIDIDNAQKVVLDALQGVMYTNDRQITTLTIKLGEPIDGGGLSVEVFPDLTWGNQ